MAQKGSKTQRFRRRNPSWNRRNNSDNISGVLNCQKCYCEDLETLYKRKSSLKQQESLPGLETSWTSRNKPERTDKSCACYFHSEAEDLYRKYFNISKEKYDDLSKRTFTIEADTAGTDKEPEEIDLESNTTAEILYKKNSSKFLNSSLTNLDVESEENLEKIRKFREENYTETHGDVEAEAESHKCIFRFSLDDRLAPVPQNPNEYGLNSCLICHKPYTKGTRLVGPLEMLSKVYDHQLTPKEINLGVDVNIEMRLTERDVQVFNDCFKQKTQRPVYKNSLALRQQKMLGSVIPVGLN